MAIFTISSNTNYSAIKGSLANGDTIRIDTNNVRLTINEEPTLTNITVDSPGVSGRMTVSGAYDMSTWSVIAGTATLIDGTFPTGATLGTATGGTSDDISAINTNNGKVINAIGFGEVSGSSGINFNNGTVENSIGNLGPGVNINNGTVENAIGGDFGNANGVNVNNCVVISALGGNGSFCPGVNQNNGIVFSALDSLDSQGVGVSFGAIKFVDGPSYESHVVSGTSGRPVKKLYTLGPLNPNATVQEGIEIIELSVGSGNGGAAFQLVGGGGLVY